MIDDASRERLMDMLAHARAALRFGANYTAAEIDADEMRYMAICRAVEIVGEAASKVPSDLRVRYPQVPWTEAVGLRHVLIHGYGKVRTERLLRTVVEDFPSLIETLEQMLREPQS